MNHNTLWDQSLGCVRSCRDEGVELSRLNIFTGAIVFLYQNVSKMFFLAWDVVFIGCAQ